MLGAQAVLLANHGQTGLVPLPRPPRPPRGAALTWQAQPDASAELRWVETPPHAVIVARHRARCPSRVARRCGGGGWGSSSTHPGLGAEGALGRREGLACLTGGRLSCCRDPAALAHRSAPGWRHAALLPAAAPSLVHGSVLGQAGAPWLPPGPGFTGVGRSRQVPPWCFHTASSLRGVLALTVPSAE